MKRFEGGGLQVLVYNVKRMINIFGIKLLMKAMAA